MLFVNIGFASISSLTGIDLCSADPNFSCTNILGSAGNIANFNGTSVGSPDSLAGNMTNPTTTNGTNFLSLDNFFGFFTQFTQMVSFGAFIIFNGFTGGFIFNVLTHIAVVQFPAIFQLGLQTVIGAFFVTWVYYQLSGRFASGGNW